MIIFSFPKYEYMASGLKKALKCKSGSFDMLRYTNQETHIVLKENVRGETCFILGTIAPPDSNLIYFSLLAHTLKKQGAKKVVAVLPYLAYSRHDKFIKAESLATEWIGKILRNSGIDKIITFDIHSEKDKKIIQIPIKSISAAELFAGVISKSKLKSRILVAPDHGALKWCDAVKKEAKIKTGIAHFEKQRTKSGMVLSDLIGEIGEEAIIVDDMIDTGKTLVLACKKLKNIGVKKITIMVTHGIFTGNYWEKLPALGVEAIYCSDTLTKKYIPKNRKIRVLPIIAVLAKNLK